MKLLLSESDLDQAVRVVADELTRDLAGKNPVLVCVLKGAFLFFADLVRKLDFPFDIEFMRVASYGSGTRSSGEVKMSLATQMPIAGRHVVIVEDLADSGHTLKTLREALEPLRPASLRIAALLDKVGRREVTVDVDYVGVRRRCGFVVGYGTDCAERFRCLREMYELEPGEISE